VGHGRGAAREKGAEEVHGTLSRRDVDGGGDSTCKLFALAHFVGELQQSHSHLWPLVVKRPIHEVTSTTVTIRQFMTQRK
jgi:hypothetical protein